jgi:hypothetical protein
MLKELYVLLSIQQSPSDTALACVGFMVLVDTESFIVQNSTRLAFLLHEVWQPMEGTSQIVPEELSPTRHWKPPAERARVHPQAAQAIARLPRQLHPAHTVVSSFYRATPMLSDKLCSAAGAMTMTAGYGLDIKPSNDPYIDNAEKAMVAFSSAVAPGAFLVDAIPALKYVPAWFPGAGFKRKAYEWRRLTRAMVEVPFYDSEKAAVSGTMFCRTVHGHMHTERICRLLELQIRVRSFLNVSATLTRCKM